MTVAAVSQNGYTANDRSIIRSYTIPGTTTKVALRMGDTSVCLLHFLAWFDKNIESIDGGPLDDWGYAERPIRGSKTVLSNHASGTGVDVNASRHPLGKRGTFTAEQTAKIRAKLKEYGGVIRWGGDYEHRADEMHFEINRGIAAVKAIADKIRSYRGKLPPTSPRDRVLKPGMTGDDVLGVQMALNRLGNHLPLTKKLDPATVAVLKVFQGHRGLPVTGIVDADTWAKLHQHA